MSAIAPTTAAWTTEEWGQARARRLGGSFLGTRGITLQQAKNDCGPAALCTLLERLGIPHRKPWVYGLLPCNGSGVTMLALKRAAARLGVRMTGQRVDPSSPRGVQTPLLAAVAGHHFVVITQIDDWGWLEVADPAIGLFRFPSDQFCRIWRGECLVLADTEAGICSTPSRA